MREIKFRGKRIKDNKFVYGYLEVCLVDGDLSKKEKHAFITYETMDEIGKVYKYTDEVEFNTIGQYTGLNDKNDIEIYDGDIVKSNKSKYKRFDDDGIYEVYFNEFLCHYALIASRNEWEHKNEQYDNYSLTGAKKKDFEVIGNIHENIEMLNKSK